MSELLRAPVPAMPAMAGISGWASTRIFSRRTRYFSSAILYSQLEEALVRLRQQLGISLGQLFFQLRIACIPLSGACPGARGQRRPVPLRAR
jgi:hypothetical protein